MSQDPDRSLNALEKAHQALREGKRREARRWAEQALAADPDQEEPWLILASLASPRASLDYLKRALEINPSSQRARKGMDWAVRRLRAAEPAAQPAPRPLVPQSIASEALVRPKPAFLPWALIALLLLAGFLLWFGSPTFSFALGGDNPLPLAQINVPKNTRTPTATATFTPTPTFTSSPTPTDTSTFTPTSTPTDTPTATPVPTDTPRPTKPPKSSNRPQGVGNGERWVDVDLSKQRAYAYEGDQVVKKFVVSTGTWLHPTVTGRYHIYVKYRYADMAGPGYYLPNVPYVMYFYKGYGLHGTYWHHNFGTPMSHGCVNFTIPDSEWLFGWASVGTLVNVHP